MDDRLIPNTGERALLENIVSEYIYIWFFTNNITLSNGLILDDFDIHDDYEFILAPVNWIIIEGNPSRAEYPQQGIEFEENLTEALHGYIMVRHGDHLIGVQKFVHEGEFISFIPKIGTIIHITPRITLGSKKLD